MLLLPFSIAQQLQSRGIKYSSWTEIPHQLRTEIGLFLRAPSVRQLYQNLRLSLMCTPKRSWLAAAKSYDHAPLVLAFCFWVKLALAAELTYFSVC